MATPLNYPQVQEQLRKTPRRWIVTGAAGFIGSNLCHTLVGLDQKVVGIDNLITGHKRNLDGLQGNFEFVEGDLRDLKLCEEKIRDGDYLIHQAALGSVPRSIENPMNSHDHNVNGFLNVLRMCSQNKIPMVYASSSSVYGDSAHLPKRENEIGKPLSPYAATKFINEVYADVFAKVYDVKITGLRYFNVFGPRQDPNGPYAAVIPKWVQKLMNGEDAEIYGDGETSRDFCYVANAVQANILAAFHSSTTPPAMVFNVAAEKQTSLNALFEMIQEALGDKNKDYKPTKPSYKPFRKGDIRHSLASIESAKNTIGYSPTHDIQSGLQESISWYLENL